MKEALSVLAHELDTVADALGDQSLLEGSIGGQARRAVAIVVSKGTIGDIRGGMGQAIVV